MDVMMDDPDPRPSVDQDLADAMRSHGRVVLAASHQVIMSTAGRPSKSCSDQSIRSSALPHAV